MEEASKAFNTLLNMKQDQLSTKSWKPALIMRVMHMNIINEVSDLGMVLCDRRSKHRAEVEKALKGLGFTAKLTSTSQQFGGGWRMRIELAKILLQNRPHPTR
jgi:ATP-binding cassette subfamily F protein 3